MTREAAGLKSVNVTKDLVRKGTLAGMSAIESSYPSKIEGTPSKP